MKTITAKHTANTHFEAMLIAEYTLRENIRKYPRIRITVHVPVKDGDTIMMWANPRF